MVVFNDKSKVNQPKYQELMKKLDKIGLDTKLLAKRN